MGSITRIRFGLVMVAVFAAALAFIGIQRIVALTDKSANIDTGAQTAEAGLNLLDLIGHTERAASKLHFEDLKEKLGAVKVAKNEFIMNLRPWLEDMKAADETFEPDLVLASIEKSMDSWRSSMHRLLDTPKNNDWYTPTVPRFDRKTSLRVRGLVNRLIVQIQKETVDMRQQAAAGIRLLALIALAVAGIAAVMAWRMRARLGAPIDGIYKVLGRALDGDLQRRTGLSANDEVGQIGARVDRLLDQLERNDLNRLHALRPTGDQYHVEPPPLIAEAPPVLDSVEEEPEDPRQAALPMTMIHKLPEDQDT